MVYKTRLEIDDVQIRGGHRWTLEDERLYLSHAVKNDGKNIYFNESTIDGVAIIENWLNTYKKRRWDFSGVEALKQYAQVNLLTLKAQRNKKLAL